MYVWHKQDTKGFLLYDLFFVSVCLFVGLENYLCCEKRNRIAQCVGCNCFLLKRMGNCGYAPVVNSTKDVSLQNNSEFTIEDSMENLKNNNTWKKKLTKKEALLLYVADNTLPSVNSCNYLELRQTLVEPVLLQSFAKYALERDKLVLILMWIDILEFKNVDEKCVMYQIAIAEDIVNAYLEKDIIQKVVSVVKDTSVREILTLLRDAKEKCIGVSSQLFDSYHIELIKQLQEELFIPYQETKEYTQVKLDFRSVYNRVDVDDFEYYNVLGSGGFGFVVHCKKKSTGIHYAMKIQTKIGLLECFSDCPQRVIFEKQALAQCNHPFIVSMAYAFQTQGLALMVMELCSAGTLLEAAAECRGSVLPPERLVFYAAEIVSALQFIHRMGLIYRDVKPHNILLNADGHVQLVDMGGVIDVGGAVLGYDNNKDEMEGMFAQGTKSVGEVSACISGNVKKLRHSGQVNRPGSSTDSSYNDNKPLLTGIFTPAADDSSDLCNGSTSTKTPPNVESSANGGSVNLSASNRSSSSYKMARAITVKRATSVMGTGGYIAPEMLAMVAPGSQHLTGYTASVDYWSLGVSIFKLMTNKLPFQHQQLSGFVAYVLAKSDDPLKKSLPKDYKQFLNSIFTTFLFDKPTQDFFYLMMELDASKRPGRGAASVEKIYNLQYFENIDWYALSQKAMRPPVIPNAEEKNEKLDDTLSPRTFDELLCEHSHVKWLRRHPSKMYQKYFESW